MKKVLFAIWMLSAFPASSQSVPQNVEVSKETGISTLEELIEKDACEQRESVYQSMQKSMEREIFLLGEKADTQKSESEINFSLYTNEKSKASEYEKIAKDSQALYEKEKKKSGFWKIAAPVSLVIGILIGSL